MGDLTISATFTENTGQPSTGLTLSEIDLYLTRQNRVTGADDVIWDGTQNPTEEIDNVGAYIRIYADADLDTYNYFGSANYTGVTVLDQDWVNGSVGISELPIGTAVAYTYTVTDSGSGNPIAGVTINISTDIVGDNVIWAGHTDAFGVARTDALLLPRLTPSPLPYYFWKDRPGYVDDDNPDAEIVS